MSVRPFIPKDNQDLPDNYGVKIYYIDGKTEEFELADHKRIDALGMFEFMTKDDIFHWIPLQNVKRLEFDKRFSKMVEIKRKASAR